MMLKKLTERLEIVRAKKKEKKGAVALETILVAGILIAVTVGVITMFANTVDDGSEGANKAIRDAIGIESEPTP